MAMNGITKSKDENALRGRDRKRFRETEQKLRHSLVMSLKVGVMRPINKLQTKAAGLATTRSRTITVRGL